MYLKNNMEEIFVNLKIKGFENYKIGNNGTLISEKGKSKKPLMRNGTPVYDCKKIINKKVAFRMNNIPVAQLVYRHFKNDTKEDIYIYHKDGNKLNNNVDNLISYVDNKRTPELIDLFNNLATIGVKTYIKQHLFKVLNLVDYEDVIQEGLYLIWKYLPAFDIFNCENVNGAFIGFCKKYARIAFLREYKNVRYYQVVTKKTRLGKDS